MNVSSLWRYPVKSLSGIKVTSMALDEKGPLFDRRFMLVNEQGKFITQRQSPALTLLSVLDQGDAYRISTANDKASVLIPKQGQTQKKRSVTIWQDTLSLYDQGARAAAFFSTYLGFPVRLVYQARDCHRPIDTHYDHLNREVSLADGFPVLLINEASLAVVNVRSGLSLEIERFRPNMVVQGAEAFAENTWQTIKVGDVLFDVVKPCSRCVIPTIDRKTAEKQPVAWQALKAACQGADGRIYFGQNLIPRELGTVAQHATVTVIN